MIMGSTISRRQSLFAAASSVVIGSGITAGAAASVADLVPLHPDANLIRLCDEFVEAELAFRAIYDGPGAVLDDDAAEKASTTLGRRMNALLDSLESARALTAEGVSARARALAAHNGDFEFSFDDEDTMAGRLLVCLLRDAVALAGRA